MRIGRALIIPAILAFGLAGSTALYSVAAPTNGHAPISHVLAGQTANPDLYYHM